jgi:hypothetical protein
MQSIWFWVGGLILYFIVDFIVAWLFGLWVSKYQDDRGDDDIW